VTLDADVRLRCADCGTVFLFSQGERRVYIEKGFGLPKRCRPCRDERRRQRERAEVRQANWRNGPEGA
jgi:hypothetical protein